MKTCLNCGNPLRGSQTKYCDAKCQAEYAHKEFISLWQKGEKTGVIGGNQISWHIRKYLLHKVNYCCERCGWGEQNPFTLTIPLEIHHKDGDFTNNSESNLEVLCPNCHSLTENYRGAKTKGEGRASGYNSRSDKENFCIDCGKEITPGATRCRDCSNKFRSANKEIPVDREELKILIRTLPFTQFGKIFNVTDKAIRNWCDKYNLPRRASDIKKYSDEDWALV